MLRAKNEDVLKVACMLFGTRVTPAHPYSIQHLIPLYNEKGRYGQREGEENKYAQMHRRQNRQSTGCGPTLIGRAEAQIAQIGHGCLWQFSSDRKVRGGAGPDHLMQKGAMTPPKQC